MTFTLCREQMCVFSSSCSDNSLQNIRPGFTAMESAACVGQWKTWREAPPTEERKASKEWWWRQRRCDYKGTFIQTDLWDSLSPKP